MMLKFINSAAFVLLSLSALSQYTVTGTVRDEAGQSLSGASVSLEETDHVAITDQFGVFRFKGVTAGDYTVRVTYLGYAEGQEKISVSANTQTSINLKETSILTDAVVVSATRATDKTPTTFTNVNKQAIQKQNFGQDLPFLLNWTPSAVTTSDAGTGVGYTGIRIRGSDATRINVTINGIPYNDAESQGTYWVDIPDIASSAQSIQIQRGVGTSTNGGAAFGGTINLQTHQRQDAAHGEVINSFGSFGTRRHTLSFGTGLLNKYWVVDGRVSRIESDGFIDRASADLKSYYFSAGFYAKNTMLKAIAFGGKERTYQAWYGVPETKLNNASEEDLNLTAINEGWGVDQTNNLLNSNNRTFNPYLYKNQVDDYKQDNFQLHFSQRFGDALTWNAALHYTPGKGYYEEYRYKDSFSSYGLPDVTIGDSVITAADIIRRRWLDNDFYGFTSSVNVDKNNWNLIVGGGWNRYDGDHFGEIVWSEVSPVPTEYQYYFNNGDKRDFNVYGKFNYFFFNKLNAFVDVQFRGITFEAFGKENKQNLLSIKEDFTFFNPKAGLTYSLSDKQQLYASYAIANREPVRDDFADNPGKSPKHEALKNLELGYRATSNRHTLNVNYYLMSYDDQLVLTGKVNDVGAPVRTNVDKSYRMGIEVDGAIKLTDKLLWNANLTLSQNKINEFTEVIYDYGVNFDEYNMVENKYSDSDIAFSPNIIAGSSLSFMPFKNAEVVLMTKYVGKQYLDNTSNDDRRIDAYTVNDLRLGYAWKPSFVKEIYFSLLINNIFDEEYEANGYTWGYLMGPTAYRANYYYPQAGRNFMGMITLKF